MFLKTSKLKPYKLCKFKISENDEGVKTEIFEKNGIEILAEIYPANGKIQSELYGKRLNYMLNMNVKKDTEINENDGICYKSDVVNYKVISIKEWTYHKQVELEKI